MTRQMPDGVVSGLFAPCWVFSIAALATLNFRADDYCRKTKLKRIVNYQSES